MSVQINSPRNIQVIHYFIQDVIRMNQSLNVLEYLRPAGLGPQQAPG